MEPYTNRETLQQQYAQLRDLLVATPPAVAWRYMLRSTSGTSQSAPLHIVFSLEDEVMARFGQCERVLAAVGTMNMHLLNALFVRYGAVPRQKICFVNTADVGPQLSALIDDFAPDICYGFLSFVLFVLARTDAAALKALPRILISGEYLTAVQDGCLLGPLRVRAYFRYIQPAKPAASPATFRTTPAAIFRAIPTISAAASRWRLRSPTKVVWAMCC